MGVLPRSYLWTTAFILWTAGWTWAAPGSDGVGSTEDITPSRIQAELGWNLSVRVGRWNVASVRTRTTFPSGTTLECLSVDSEGHTAVFKSAEVTQPVSRLDVPFQVGRLESSIELRVISNDEVIWRKTYHSGQAAENWKPLVLSDRFIVAVGNPRGLDELEAEIGRPGHTGLHVVHVAAASELPSFAAAYEAVDWLILAGVEPPGEEVRNVLKGWVQQGGHLFVSLPARTAAWKNSPLRQWLPVPFAAEPVIVRELGSLESFAERNLRIPYAGRMEMPKLETKGATVLAASREDAVLVRMPWGFGEVWLLSLDLTSPPLANWAGLPDLLSKSFSFDGKELATQRTSSGSSIGRLTSSGISDLASQLHAAQDSFRSVERPAPWWSMAWLLGLLAIVGPLDYLIVHHLLKQPRLTWLTLPIWLAGLSAFAVYGGNHWNHRELAVNQMDVLDVDGVTGSARLKNWTTLYVPESRRYDITIKPSGEAWAPVTKKIWPGSQLTGWFFIPESTNGGLYRSTSGEWGRGEYEVQPTRGRFVDSPILKWSTRSLKTSWSATEHTLIDSQLRNTGLGRLTGRFTHRLPGRLTNWFLAYSGRVYRLQPSRGEDRSIPLEPGQTVSTDDPLMLQADLRSLLTQLVISEEVDEGKVNERRLNREQARYDVYAKDAFQLWQILTFHARAGTGYTGLTNDWLTDDDFSSQLDLGRAVLFGQLEASPLTTVETDGQAVPVAKHTAIVRMVLPVTASGEILRTLPKLDSD